jgi:hypothetical protein
MRVNYTLIVVYTTLGNLQPIKKPLMFLPGYGPMAIACALPYIGQTWVLASNDAAFEMGNFIRTLKRLLMESRAPLA